MSIFFRYFTSISILVLSIEIRAIPGYIGGHASIFAHVLAILLFILGISLISVAILTETGCAWELNRNATALLAILALEARSRLLELLNELLLHLFVGLAPAQRCRPIQCRLLALHADQSFTGIEERLVILLDSIIVVAAR